MTDFVSSSETLSIAVSFSLKTKIGFASLIKSISGMTFSLKVRSWHLYYHFLAKSQIKVPALEQAQISLLFLDPNLNWSFEFKEFQVLICCFSLDPSSSDYRSIPWIHKADSDLVRIFGQFPERRAKVVSRQGSRQGTDND